MNGLVFVLALKIMSALFSHAIDLAIPTTHGTTIMTERIVTVSSETSCFVLKSYGKFLPVGMSTWLLLAANSAVIFRSSAESFSIWFS